MVVVPLSPEWQSCPLLITLVSVPLFSQLADFTQIDLLSVPVLLQVDPSTHVLDCLLLPLMPSNDPVLEQVEPRRQRFRWSVS